MKRLACHFACRVTLIFFCFSTQLIANETKPQVLNMQQLFDLVEKTKKLDAQENKQRENDFLVQQQQQNSLLAEAKQELQQLESISNGLEHIFSGNEQLLQEKRSDMQQQMGSLQELFGHLTAAAGDFRSHLKTSIVSAQYANRDLVFDELITKINDASLLPSRSEIEALWQGMLLEMAESAKVVSFPTEVITPDGETLQQQVVRIGVFNLVSENSYLSYSAETKSISELSRQPSANFTHALAELHAGKYGFTRIGVDPTGPTGGSYLAALVDSPSMIERWHQGGVVGYIISIIGLLTAMIVLWRLVVLTRISRDVLASVRGGSTMDNNQVHNKVSNNTKHNTDNILCRIFAVHEKHIAIDAETLEVKLTQALLNERPQIEKWLPQLKIVAMVAPLLGLLGTVAGMILTFQAITIYGAGDPKAMASGISSALVTTVLGLLVAIPTVFAHSLLNDKAQGILHVLEQQCMGFIAYHNEFKSEAVGN